MRSFGPMISCEICVNAARADGVREPGQIVRDATSLGSIETTVEGRTVIPDQQHLPPTLLRLSASRENVEDFWSDRGGALGA
jgi:cystathionine gamma-synthase